MTRSPRAPSYPRGRGQTGSSPLRSSDRARRGLHRRIRRSGEPGLRRSACRPARLRLAGRGLPGRERGLRLCRALPARHGARFPPRADSPISRARPTPAPRYSRRSCEGRGPDELAIVVPMGSWTDSPDPAEGARGIALALDEAERLSEAERSGPSLPLSLRFVFLGAEKRGSYAEGEVAGLGSRTWIGRQDGREPLAVDLPKYGRRLLARRDAQRGLGASSAPYWYYEASRTALDGARRIDYGIAVNRLQAYRLGSRERLRPVGALPRGRHPGDRAEEGRAEPTAAPVRQPALIGRLARLLRGPPSGRALEGLPRFLGQALLHIPARALRSGPPREALRGLPRRRRRDSGRLLPRRDRGEEVRP